MIEFLPPEVLAVIQNFRTCEFTTLAKGGSPVTWPVSARYLPDEGRFLMTSSIGLPNKIFHIRRNPHVSLLFSNPTGSGLTNPPIVLVQGDAEAGDEIVTSMRSIPGLHEYWLENIFSRQPASDMMSNMLLRNMTDWYYMRIVIHITPITWYWWPDGDLTRAAQKMEVAHVE